MNAHELLTQALQALGLRYELRRVGEGVVPSFRYEVARGELVQFDAQVRNGVLQFRACAGHGSPAFFARINELNRRWWLGRVYLDEHDALNASTGVLLAHTTSLPNALSTVFALLRRAAWFLLRVPGSFAGLGDDAFSTADESFEDSFAALVADEADQVPRVEGAPLEALAEILAKIGAPFLVQNHGTLLTQRFSFASNFVVELFVLHSALLCMRTRHLSTTVVTDPEVALRALGRLNQRFAIGSAVIDGPRLHVQLALQLRQTRLDTDLARWLIERAHAAMEAVDRELATCDLKTIRGHMARSL
jgi:hypothetical protein